MGTFSLVAFYALFAVGQGIEVEFHGIISMFKILLASISD